MSYSRVMSAVLCGLEVIPVQVEADLSNGLPMFHMVGYLSAEVKEAGERVRTAISNSGFSLLPKRRSSIYRREISEKEGHLLIFRSPWQFLLLPERL